METASHTGHSQSNWHTPLCRVSYRIVSEHCTKGKSHIVWKQPVIQDILNLIGTHHYVGIHTELFLNTVLKGSLEVHTLYGNSQSYRTFSINSLLIGTHHCVGFLTELFLNTVLKGSLEVHTLYGNSQSYRTFS